MLHLKLPITHVLIEISGVEHISHKVTFEVSQKLISELNEDLSLNTSVILVTRVVHKFTLPLSTSPWMVELSRMFPVSPTEAFGHLHVPFSK